MDRDGILKNSEEKLIYDQLLGLHRKLGTAFSENFNRSIPFTEEVFDRWERAKLLGFGEGTSIYDSAFVFGEVTVGKKCWIGPFTIIDGSGGLTIGDFCTISAGVHIYTHDNVMQTLSSHVLPIVHDPVTIGNNTYVGPQSIIAKNVNIGAFSVVAANSFVNKSFDNYSIIAGNPAKQIGLVKINDNKIEFEYFKEK